MFVKNKGEELNFIHRFYKIFLQLKCFFFELVDDHAFLLKTLKSVLNGRQFEEYTFQVILQAENGEDLIWKLKQCDLPNI
jgi:hypothetical protein